MASYKIRPRLQTKVQSFKQNSLSSNTLACKTKIMAFGIPSPACLSSCGGVALYKYKALGKRPAFIVSCNSADDLIPTAPKTPGPHRKNHQILNTKNNQGFTARPHPKPGLVVFSSLQFCSLVALVLLEALNVFKPSSHPPPAKVLNITPHGDEVVNKSVRKQNERYDSQCRLNHLIYPGYLETFPRDILAHCKAIHKQFLKRKKKVL